MAGYLALNVMDGSGVGVIQNQPQSDPSSPDSTSLIGESVEASILQAVKDEDEDALSHALLHASSSHLDIVFPYPDLACAIHISVQKESPSLVALLLTKGASPNIKDLRGKKYTPLHYAVQCGNSQITKLLVDYGANANAKEGEFGRTSLHLLAMKWKTAEDGCKACLKVLLEQKRIKIDSSDSSGATPLFLAAQKGIEHLARELIMKGADIECKVGNKTASDVLRKKIPGLLESIDFSTVEKPKRFFGEDLYEALKVKDLEEFKQIMEDLVDANDSSKLDTLEEDHGEFTLLTYACEHGMAKFVELLLAEGVDPTKGDDTSKVTPVILAARNGYHEVLDLLLSSMKKFGHLERGALKAVDRKGETPLHKVVKREFGIGREGVNYVQCLHLLISYKRFLYIDAQDEFGNTALHYAVLCDDQSFVRFLLLKGAHLGIKNKFGSLAISRIQPSVLEEVLNDCIKHRNNVTDRDFELILHYSMLVPSNANHQPETECLKFLSASKPHRHLLRHPIIDTFLFLKWQRIKRYYFINLLAYSAFLFLLTSYILLYFGTIKQHFDDEGILVNNTEQYNLHTNTYNIVDNLAFQIALTILICILWLYIAIREVFQILVSWKKYIQNYENWLEITILLLTFILLFIPLYQHVKQSIAAWLILFAWIEFILVMGRHPWCSVYITMFTTVSYNFFKFIVMFFFMVIAFSLSFYLVFQINENYINYPKTLLKTIAMSTGEIEYTELPLSHFPISSHMLFALFVFLVVLVLMNLLNGLAVSDIQQIQQEAEIVSYRSRVNLISYIESIFMANPHSNDSEKDTHCDMSDCCFRPKTPSPIYTLLHYLGKRTLMFRHCLQTPQIKLFPNRGNDRWFVCSCHSFQLEEYQIEAAKSVVLMERQQVSDQLSALDSRVTLIMEQLGSLTKMVKDHVLCPPQS